MNNMKWAAKCLRRVLPLYEQVHKGDRRVKWLIDKAHAVRLVPADLKNARCAVADAQERAGESAAAYTALRVAQGVEWLVRTQWDPTAAEHAVAAARDAVTRAVDNGIGGVLAEMAAQYRGELERKWQEAGRPV